MSAYLRAGKIDVRFAIDGPPKRYLANKVVSVAITSSFPYWVLQCQGTDLELKESKKGKIPTERLFVAIASPGQRACFSPGEERKRYSARLDLEGKVQEPNVEGELSIYLKLVVETD